MATRSKRSVASEKIIHGADQERQMVLSKGVTSQIFADDLYHRLVLVTPNWKRLEVNIAGEIKTETNNTLPALSFLGDSLPGNIADVRETGCAWGFSHNSYQYAEEGWQKTNMFSGSKMFLGMPIGDGYYYGSGTYYDLRVTVTVIPGDKFVVHSECSGNRRGSSNYMTRWITQGTFSLPASDIEYFDIGFNGQRISMAGTSTLYSHGS